MKTFLKIGFVISAATAVFLTYPAHAIAAGATIFLENEPKTPVEGREFVVRVYASSDQPLNGYELAVSFEPNKLELLRTDTARSIIDIWPKQPLVYASGDVRWSGASIEPFVGDRGELFALHLRALPGASTTTIGIRRETALYLANGKGTKITPQAQELSMTFVPAAGGEEPGSVDVPLQSLDNAPPVISFFALEQDPITPGQKLLSFQTSDSESGIANIEARARSWFLWGGWWPTRNPDALPSGVWEAELRITDHAGNVAQAIIYDWRTAGAKGGIMFLVIVLIVWIARAVLVRMRQHG
ncbi:MAG: hypothetical protein RL681_597 [Candidatus Parcubacteria bacterium]